MLEKSIQYGYVSIKQRKGLNVVRYSRKFLSQKRFGENKTEIPYSGIVKNSKQ